MLNYYTAIDAPKFNGITDNDVIRLLPKHDASHVHFANAAREWMAFNIRKSFDYQNDPTKGTVNGLSWMTSGKKTNEEAEEMDIYVSDVRALKQDDFEYV